MFHQHGTLMILSVPSSKDFPHRWFWIFWYFERNVPLQLPRHYSLPLPRWASWSENLSLAIRLQDLLFSGNEVAQILYCRDGRRWLWSKTRRCRWFLSSSKWLQDFKKHQCRCPRTLTTLRLANTMVADVLALNNLKTWKQKYVADVDLTRLER